MGNPFQNEPNIALQAKEAEACFELKAKGWSVRRIAVEVGLSPTTVQRRITEECERRLSPKVEHLRTVMDGTLDAVQTYLQSILDDPEASAVLKLNAIDRLGRTMERRAKLHGLDAPVKVDAVVTQQTQMEAEIQALFDAQEAANEATRAQIEAGQ